MQTADGVQDNISRIAELFPECITEVNDQMGVKRSIDFDKLRQLLSSDIVEGNEERYQFTCLTSARLSLLPMRPSTPRCAHAKRRAWTSTPHRTFTSRATTSMC